MDHHGDQPTCHSENIGGISLKGIANKIRIQFFFTI